MEPAAVPAVDPAPEPAAQPAEEPVSGPTAGPGVEPAAVPAVASVAEAALALVTADRVPSAASARCPQNSPRANTPPTSSATWSARRPATPRVSQGVTPNRADDQAKGGSFLPYGEHLTCHEQ